jgi:transcriptional regulator GlxA family with amidase domain
MKLFSLLINIPLLIFYFTSFAQTTSQDSLAKRHQEKMNIIMTQPKIKIKTIGILLYDGYQTLDAMGPYETLSQLGGGVKVFFVAKQKGLVSNQRGMKVQVDTSIEKVNNLDILVIPGGAAETFMLTQDTVVLNWIKKIDQTTAYTTSVCTGAWILGATGLLNGKNATTNWYRAEEMLKGYGASFKETRWVQDGKYWTSAGVTAGIDMSLAIINELMGEKFTQAVMLNLEYDPHPPVTGGSVKNSAQIVKEMIEEMYDMGMQPLFKKYKNRSLN